MQTFPFGCRKAAPESPFLRELVISFGGHGCVALFEVEDTKTVTSWPCGTSVKTTTINTDGLNLVLVVSNNLKRIFTRCVRPSHGFQMILNRVRQLLTALTGQG